MITILMVEDDDVIREATSLALARHGYTVETADDGLEALRVFDEARHDLVLLDVMLPGLDGISACRRLRELSTVPIIMLTARSDSIDVIQGLEAGADDYLTKPFDIQVLVARIHAVLRRYAPVDEAESEKPESEIGPDQQTQRFGDIIVDREALQVTKNGEPVSLTPTELRLLLGFAEAPGIVMSRQHLLERVWEYQWDGDTRVVDIHVQRLRAKIGAERIETVRGFGYRLTP